jgi:hypothetical protein
MNRIGKADAHRVSGDRRRITSRPVFSLSQHYRVVPAGAAKRATFLTEDSKENEVLRYNRIHSLLPSLPSVFVAYPNPRNPCSLSTPARHVGALAKTEAFRAQADPRCSDSTIQRFNDLTRRSHVFPVTPQQISSSTQMKPKQPKLKGNQNARQKAN